MQPLANLHCDPLVCRSVSHMRAAAHKIRQALDGSYELSPHTLCLGVQLGEMLADEPLRARCRVEACARVHTATRDGDRLLLALCVDADDPTGLAPYMEQRDHAGAYAAIRRGYAAIRMNDVPALTEVIDRLGDSTGVHGKLMDLNAECTLMVAGKIWRETEKVPWEILRQEMQTLPGHLAQGLALDAQHLFCGMTFGTR